ncbi:hypothetical protein ACH4VS_18075 [Streptomyces hygroscopicus]|uniref:hypothetical protein n=1 Tax=Streptomyces hygroscopicus TaxID=1912 RepID=UPI00082E3742|nr:hypothetical protein [Streptomyces hygroscopicus]GLV74391.1 hypothetical protein Shyhy02_23930 [Streptomyces hygroscopicus subsp. hygroscopicus]
MTTEDNHPVYTLAPHAPWREILRQRLSGRRDRALVLRDRAGAHHVLGTRHPRGAEPAMAADRAVSFPGLLGGYEEAFRVRLGEQSETRSVTLPTAYGTESVDVRVLWWVHDPAQVVRSRTTCGWDVVRKNLDWCLHQLEEVQTTGGRSFGAPEMMHHLAAPQRLERVGLTYCVTDVQARDTGGELRLGQPGDAGLPYSWTAHRREEYEFCTQALRNGPLSLAALWLVRHPDQVSQVLDWSVRNPGLVREETDWQEEMAGLLGKLTPQEQQELSELLRDRLVSLGRRVPGPRKTRVNGRVDQPSAV